MRDRAADVGRFRIRRRDRARIAVAGHRVIERLAEDLRLAAGEGGEHRPHRHTRFVRDVLDGGADVAVANEQPRCGVADRLAGSAGRFLPQR